MNEDVNLKQQATIAKSEMMRIYKMKDWQIEMRKTEKNKINNGAYNVYRIDTRQLPIDITFYGDPNYPKG